MLAGAISSSIGAIVEGDKQKTLATPDLASTKVDLDIVKIEAQNPDNIFDTDAFNHYQVINTFIEDKNAIKNIKEINNSKELKIEITKKVNNIFSSDEELYYSYNTQSTKDLVKELERLELKPGEAYYQKEYYNRVYEIRKGTIDEKLTKVLDLYDSVFIEINNEMSVDKFIEYSVKMEKLIMEDKSLTEKLKNSLLFEMATLRYGVKYYSNF